MVLAYENEAVLDGEATHARQASEDRQSHPGTGHSRVPRDDPLSPPRSGDVPVGFSGISGEKMYAKPSSLLDSQAPSVLVADCGLLLAGTKGLSEQTASGACNGLPITVAL